jgi:hypothetical protein
MRIWPGEAHVEIGGKTRMMVFVTNNTQWIPLPACNLYKHRRGGNVFFNQAIKLESFLGYNQNAVAWRIDSVLNSGGAASPDPTGPVFRQNSCLTLKA